MLLVGEAEDRRIALIRAEVAVVQAEARVRRADMAYTSATIRAALDPVTMSDQYNAAAAESLSAIDSWCEKRSYLVQLQHATAQAEREGSQ